MTTITDRTIHLTRIGYALATAKEAFLHSYGMEDDQKAIKALVNEFGRNLRDLVEVCTKDFHDEQAKAYLDGIENAINDEVDNEFADAITVRDQAAEDARDPILRAASRSDARAA
jgi:hypothetical protein